MIAYLVSPGPSASVSYIILTVFSSAASGDVQTYQIRTAPTSTIAPGVVMASSPALPTQPAEEAARKREVRLMKNRYIMYFTEMVVSPLFLHVLLDVCLLHLPTIGYLC